MRTGISFKREKLAELARTLNAVSPLETMGRGYAVVTGSESGELVSSISQLEAGDRVSTRLKDGTFEGTVDSVHS
jgi:exodeoxyribonuclease VII large subunit